MTTVNTSITMNLAELAAIVDVLCQNLKRLPTAIDDLTVPEKARLLELVERLISHARAQNSLIQELSIENANSYLFVENAMDLMDSFISKVGKYLNKVYSNLDQDIKVLREEMTFFGFIP